MAATEPFSIRLVYMLDLDSLANECLQLLGSHTMLQITLPVAACSDMLALAGRVFMASLHA